MGAFLNHAVDRISIIKFEDAGSKSESHHILISEYFRIINNFLDKLSVSVENYPIVRVASVLGKVTAIDIIKACPALKNIQNVYIKAICYSYLEVSALADEGVVEVIEYMDLYEPMLKFLERGGRFRLIQGELLVELSAYPLSYWRGLKIAKQDISDDHLDIIDRDTNY
ncbi:hypothetical protein [Cohnella sp. GCM10027633]|uniref:hypothetical protein n=1 Tax=unclassified Cohnella TaxID=2636738 RepID=UPI003644F35E